MRREADWNDWRHFLAVARAGSTLTAARQLRVSQTTVARRIAALEEALGTPLFERRPAGYALTAGGEALLPRAEAVEQAALAAERQALASAREVSGTVRLSAEDIFVIGLIAPHIPDFHDLYPEVRIEIDSSPGIRDLAGGEADVVLRSTATDQPAGVVGRIIGQDLWTLYCSRAYAERHGIPRTIDDLRHHNIIGGGGGQLAREYNAWLEQVGLLEQVTIQQGTATGLLTAAQTGLGVTVLPCIVADAMPDLVQCIPPPHEQRRLWLLTHERVRHSPAVRTVIDFLYERLSAHARRLERARERPAAA